MESELGKILVTLNPKLCPGEYVFCSIQGKRLVQIVDLAPIATFAEAEGLTVILDRQRAVSAGLAFDGTWRMITLEVFSSLESVGLTAVVSNALAKTGISANMIAAYHHDHVFVPSVSAQTALQVLQSLQRCGVPNPLD